MNSRNIVFTKPYVAELLCEEMGDLKAGYVRVRILRTTVSPGTERANLIGDANVAGKKAPEVKFPRRMGYSASGVVYAVGEGVESVKVGDRVACSWTKHAEYYDLPEGQVYMLDDDITLEEASVVHIATFPLAAIRKCRLEIGESAMVMGLGVLGMIAVQLLRIAGAAPIIAVDPVAERREEALKMGADFALDPYEEDFADKAKALTGGGVKVCIEVTGFGNGLDMGLDCMAKFGRVALLGCTRNSDFTIDYYRKVHSMGVSLIGAHTMARPKKESFEGWWCERDDAFALLKLIKLGRLDLHSFIAETHSPMDCFDVFTRLANERSFPVVQFDWSKLQ